MWDFLHTASCCPVQDSQDQSGGAALWQQMLIIWFEKACSLPSTAEVIDIAAS
jgi:hypothetical protein